MFLIIIGIITIIILPLFAFTIYDSSTVTFIKCVPPYEQVDKKCIMPTFKILLDDPIHPNDPLVVSVEKKGYYMCDEWDAKIIDTADNSTVWEEEHFTFCVVTSPLKQQKFLYPISNENNPIVIDNVGRYLFQINIGGQFLEEEFLVLNTISTISLDRTVYPDLQFCADEFNKMYQQALAIPCSCCDPLPGEPICEPVPLEGHIRDMITDEFKPCIGILDKWAYLTEHSNSVWYAFGTNYVKLKMEKTNHEENIPISITFSGYSQCLNDFHLIVKEHISGEKVVFEESFSQVCDESKSDNEFKTYREINLDGIGEPIILPKGQYFIELYTKTPQIRGSNYVDKVYFSSHFETGPVIELNGINQKNPSIWSITGKTSDVESEIILNLYNPENVLVTSDIIVPNSDGEFSTVITTGGSLFKLPGHYKITLQQGDVDVPQINRLFEMTKEH